MTALCCDLNGSMQHFVKNGKAEYMPSKQEIVEVQVQQSKQNGCCLAAHHLGDTVRERFPEKLSRLDQLDLQRQEIESGSSRWSLRVDSGGVWASSGA
jgi:hypothetical protein